MAERRIKDVSSSSKWDTTFLRNFFPVAPVVLMVMEELLGVFNGIRSEIVL
jgi:hypothetical protein